MDDRDEASLSSIDDPHSHHSPPDFAKVLAGHAAWFDEKLAACSFLKPTGDPADRLVEAMRYALLGPGKRLRPFLVTESAVACGGNREAAVIPAIAMECVHAFSLVHDDLPAMDDDDLRRGRPTTHKAFDDATAILAGDALLTEAFQLLADEVADATVSRRLISVLARATGARGMIGGQMGDILGEGLSPDMQQVLWIHYHKTAYLFEASCRMGAIVAGADRIHEDMLGSFGLKLGLAFQVADDIQDATATVQQTGKQVRRDENMGKQTYPACVGIDEARVAVRRLVMTALFHIAGEWPEAEGLRQAAIWLGDRHF